jgi:hypothetical protein
MARFQVEKENENIQVNKNQINFRESKPISFLIKCNSRNYFAVPFNALKVKQVLRSTILSSTIVSFFFDN